MGCSRADATGNFKALLRATCFAATASVGALASPSQGSPAATIAWSPSLFAQIPPVRDPGPHLAVTVAAPAPWVGMLARPVPPGPPPPPMQAAAAASQTLTQGGDPLQSATMLLAQDVAELGGQLRRDHPWEPHPGDYRAIQRKFQAGDEVGLLAAPSARAWQTPAQPAQPGRSQTAPTPSQLNPAPAPTAAPGPSTAPAASITCGEPGQPACEEQFMALDWRNVAVPGIGVAILILGCYLRSRQLQREGETMPDECFEDMHEVWVLNKQWRQEGP